MRLLYLLAVVAATLVTPAQAETARTRVAIIIDDMGNNRSDLDAATLPGKVTFSVLPFTPYARAFALRAHHQQKQLLLHSPMQAVEGNRLGPGALTANMSNVQIKLMLQRTLDAVPYVVGMNNHMGSYFTQLHEPMQAVMETLQQRQLFFIDSRTSEYSVAEYTAAQFGVATSHRHVFLDNQTDRPYLEQQWQQLLAKAGEQGMAIAIGHPYPETIAFLRDKIPTLQQQDIELVFASELVVTPSKPLPRRLLEASE